MFLSIYVSFLARKKNLFCPFLISWTFDPMINSTRKALGWGWPGPWTDSGWRPERTLAAWGGEGLRGSGFWKTRGDRRSATASEMGRVSICCLCNSVLYALKRNKRLKSKSVLFHVFSITRSSIALASQPSYKARLAFDWSKASNRLVYFLLPCY